MEEIVICSGSSETNILSGRTKKAVALFRAKAKRGEAKAKIIHDSIFAMEQYSEDIRLIIIGVLFSRR
jgi:hypothetical protein